MCFTRVGPSLARKYWIRLERLARDKHFILLRKSVNYGRNKFYSTSPCGQYYKTFLAYFTPLVVYFPKILTKVMLIRHNYVENSFITLATDVKNV
jgi:hypothetical protein